MPLTCRVAAKRKPLQKPDAEFKLSITRALRDQLVAALSTLTPAPLSAVSVANVQARGGVYAIFLAGELVYVGKADKSLSSRLAQHSRKLAGRIGPFTGAVNFICLYMEEDLEASAPEKLLIKWYRKESALPWNNNGFGNKDPGRKRDTTEVKANHFDALYPINLDLTIPLTAGKKDVLACLKELKGVLPYNLRFASVPRADLATQLVVPVGGKTVRHWIKLIVEALPSGWLATALPGYVILYRESDPDKYESATFCWLKDADGSVQECVGQRHQAAPGEIEDDEGEDSDDADNEGEAQDT